MKNYLLVLISIILLLTSCGGEQQMATTIRQPIVIVLGRDISQSFKGYNQFNPQHINSVCEAAEKSGSDVVIAFGTIGNPTDSSFFRCVIHGVPTPNLNATLTQKAKYNEGIVKLKASNSQAISDFVAKANSMATRPLESNTDVNGFLEKANRLFSEPQFNGYNKLFYANTDGIHSVGSDTALVCNIPKDVQIYVSGWKNAHNISSNKPFESSEGFVSFISIFLNK